MSTQSMVKGAGQINTSETNPIEHSAPSSPSACVDQADWAGFRLIIPTVSAGFLIGCEDS